ncbi:MAG: ABC transporter permease [Firmicutes bacterium]|nr:ABC transporter permease [Bacillota bacterium]
MKNKTLLKNSKLSDLLRSREASLLLVLILLCAVIQWRSGGKFLSGTVVSQLMQNYAYIMVLAFGMLLVLLIGGIDISIGATVALSGMSTCLLMRDGIITNPALAYGFSILVGAVCGLVIGVIISKGNVIPIIATLGMQYIYRGLTYFVSGTLWVSADKMLPGYKAFAQGSFLGINNLFWIVLVVFAGILLFLKWTGFGRQIYAVGSNADAARISGINIDRVKIIVYTINGSIAGLAGAMYTSLYASAQGNMATGTEMDVIAACVIGGVSLNGGLGNGVGVFLGAITIAVISKSLSLVGIDAFWQRALKGAVILLAVLINVLVQRNASRKALEGREI